MIKVATAGYSTYQVSDKAKAQRWRVVQTISLDAGDFTAAATLITRLQDEDGLLLSGMGFALIGEVAPRRRGQLHATGHQELAAARAAGGAGASGSPRGAGRVTVQATTAGASIRWRACRRWGARRRSAGRAGGRDDRRYRFGERRGAARVADSGSPGYASSSRRRSSAPAAPRRLVELLARDMARARARPRAASCPRVRLLGDRGGLVVADVRVERGHQHQRARQSSAMRSRFGSMPRAQCSSKLAMRVGEQPHALQEVVDDQRLEDVELEVARRAAEARSRRRCPSPARRPSSAPRTASG